MIPAENCAGVLCTADNLLFKDGGTDWSTTWYIIEFAGNKYKLNNRMEVTVFLGSKRKQVTLQEAIDNNYEIDEESIFKHKVTNG